MGKKREKSQAPNGDDLDAIILSRRFLSRASLRYMLGDRNNDVDDKEEAEEKKQGERK